MMDESSLDGVLIPEKVEASVADPVGVSAITKCRSYPCLLVPCTRVFDEKDS